ncbi:MAG: VanZ family protein [Burkholderiales bacterium]|nr:VanZ family protein [Opitutaceae bacterium]
MRLFATHASATGADAPSRLRWVYPLLLATMIVIASGRSHVAAPPIVDIDKLVHFSVFGLLATLVARAPGMRHAWVAVLAVSLFGISDEFRQSLTPGRSVEFNDWLADTAGACLAVGLYSFWAWYRRLLEISLLPRRRRAKPDATSAASLSSDASAPAA